MTRSHNRPERERLPTLFIDSEDFGKNRSHFVSLYASDFAEDETHL